MMTCNTKPSHEKTHSPKTYCCCGLQSFRDKRAMPSKIGFCDTPAEPNSSTRTQSTPFNNDPTILDEPSSRPPLTDVARLIEAVLEHDAVRLSD